MTAFIYDAVRSPRGKARPDGGLATVPPHELVRQLFVALNERTEGGAGRAEELVLGCVGQVGSQGGNIALVSKLYADLPDAVRAWTLNNYCVSGLTAIGQAAASISSGRSALALAGGVEMMSRVGFMADKADYYVDNSFSPRTRYVPVAVAADRLAANEKVDRASLDRVALASQSKAVAAEENAALGMSRIPIHDPTGAILLDRDECVRATTVERLAGLQPAFGELVTSYRAALGGDKIEPLHTVAHAPPMCDAAALALIGTENAVNRKPRARIVSYADAAGDPAASLTAGFGAMERTLDRAGLKLSDMDRIEFMESFGVTIVKFLRDYDVDPERVNVGGGHIARGHPLGASGAILVSSVLDALDEVQGKYGLVVGTGASGVGAAIILER